MKALQIANQRGEGGVPPFCDVHAHIIYGVDDGAHSLDMMQNMLDASYADGVRTIYATSHVTPGVQPFDQDAYLRHLAEAEQYCARKGYDLQVLPGAEILYSSLLERLAVERLLPTLGNSDTVLVEFLPDTAYDDVEEAVRLLLGSGYHVILAHVERYKCLYHRNAYRLKEECSVRYQVNCSTVIDGQGFLKTREIRRWFGDGLIDCVASDCHDLSRRPTRMREAYAALAEAYGEAYAESLVSCAAGL